MDYKSISDILTMMPIINRVVYRKSTKVAVFIDAANVIYSQRTLGWQIDFKKLMDYLTANYKIDRVFFYSAHISSNAGQQGFFNKLRDWGYTIKTKEVKIIKQSDGTLMKKGNLDVELTIDAVRHISNFSTAILMSGDSDFCALVKYLQFKNKKVVVISSKGHIARELLKACNKYINFNSLRGLLKGSKNPKVPLARDP